METRKFNMKIQDLINYKKEEQDLRLDFERKKFIRVGPTKLVSINLHLYDEEPYDTDEYDE